MTGYQWTHLARAQRASETRTLVEAMRDDFMLWAFCVWCGHARLFEAKVIRAEVKEPLNILDELERRLVCKSCKTEGVKLIPTDRTWVARDRMGFGMRDGPPDYKPGSDCPCGQTPTHLYKGVAYCQKCFDARTEGKPPTRVTE